MQEQKSYHTVVLATQYAMVLQTLCLFQNSIVRGISIYFPFMFLFFKQSYESVLLFIIGCIE